MEIMVNQVRLFYTRSGHGAPLLLLHGNGEDHTLFADLIPLLATTHTVYALDSRDHGQSQRDVPLSYQLMADDVMAFADALHLEDISLVGFSDGAIIGILVASQRPALVHKLVLAGANLTPAGLKWPVRAAARLRQWRRADPRLELMLKEPQITTAELGRIRALTFVLAGANDMIKEKETIAIASGIPIAVLRIVPKATHSSYVTNNAEFYHYIRAFLTGGKE